MGNGEALKGDQDGREGGREVAKSDDNTLNCGEKAPRATKMC